MTDTCVHCGATGSTQTIALPSDWWHYLRQIRGFSMSTGSNSVPLCADCYEPVAYARESSLSPGDTTDAASPVGEFEVAAFLDGLDLDALNDPDW